MFRFSTPPWRIGRTRKKAFRIKDDIEKLVSELERIVPDDLSLDDRVGENLGFHLQALAKRIDAVSARADFVFATHVARPAKPKPI